MKLVTWNCYRGECRTRAAELDAQRPDVVVLQECGRPTPGPDSQCVWFGSRPTQGVAVLTRGEWNVEPGPLDPAVTDSVFPVRVAGPTPFHLLAVWAQRRPTYVQAVLNGVLAYRDFLFAAPAVVAGDFNSHPRWDKKSSAIGHASLAKRLRDEFGLVDAYAAAATRDGVVGEAPTHYWRWQADQPFHIDYCFIPEAWLPGLRSVEVGGYAEWAQLSDHRPVAVDVDLCPGRQPA